MRRMVLAILAGYVLIGVLVSITDRLFAMFLPGFAAVPAHLPQSYFAASLVTDFVYSLIGGYVCGRIARERLWEATWCLIALGETIGVAAQFVMWSVVPHWFGIGLLVVYPIGVWIGSRLYGERRAVTI